MKKFLKVVSSLCLVLVVGAAVLLSGCTKKYTVTISASVGGNVYKLGSEAVSLIGENEVEEGNDLTLAIFANAGYYIKEVAVDGKAVDMSDWAKKEDYVVSHEFTLSDIKADTNVVVTFAVQIKTLTFRFIDTQNDNAVKATQAYKIPCHTTFNLFNPDGDSSSTGTLFFTSATSTTGMLKLSLKGADATVFVKEADATKIAAIITKLDAIFTTEAGCEKI